MKRQPNFVASHSNAHTPAQHNTTSQKLRAMHIDLIENFETSDTVFLLFNCYKRSVESWTSTMTGMEAIII